MPLPDYVKVRVFENKLFGDVRDRNSGEMRRRLYAPLDGKLDMVQTLSRIDLDGLVRGWDVEGESCF